MNKIKTRDERPKAPPRNSLLKRIRPHGLGESAAEDANKVKEEGLAPMHRARSLVLLIEQQVEKENSEGSGDMTVGMLRAFDLYLRDVEHEYRIAGDEDTQFIISSLGNRVRDQLTDYLVTTRASDASTAAQSIPEEEASCECDPLGGKFCEEGARLTLAGDAAIKRALGKKGGALLENIPEVEELREHLSAAVNRSVARIAPPPPIKIKSRHGWLSEKPCPKCGGPLLTNDYGQEWCSYIGPPSCTYGMQHDQDCEVNCLPLPDESNCDCGFTEAHRDKY